VETVGDQKEQPVSQDQFEILQAACKQIISTKALENAVRIHVHIKIFQLREDYHKTNTYQNKGIQKPISLRDISLNR